MRSSLVYNYTCNFLLISAISGPIPEYPRQCGTRIPHTGPTFASHAPAKILLFVYFCFCTQTSKVKMGIQKPLEFGLMDYGPGRVFQSNPLQSPCKPCHSVFSLLLVLRRKSAQLFDRLVPRNQFHFRICNLGFEFEEENTNLSLLFVNQNEFVLFCFNLRRFS